MGNFKLDENGSQKKPTQSADVDAKSTSQSDAAGQSTSFEAGQLQRTAGNAAVQRLAVQQKSDGQTSLDEDTATDIQREKGNGFTPDAQAAGNTSAVTQTDYSDVKIHTDAKADQLSRQLGAKAFTVGEDVFFRSGEYQPDSQDGQKLLSHELTHVTQQKQGVVSGGTPQAKLTVTAADDQFEKEADSVADQVVTNSSAESDHDAGQPVQRQAAPEEEELQMKRETVQREAMPEEEELQMQRDGAVQREATEDEELLQG